jgi:SpoVK/Ycf46/Vps4 family AAA+-type ATPase
MDLNYLVGYLPLLITMNLSYTDLIKIALAIILYISSNEWARTECYALYARISKKNKYTYVVKYAYNLDAGYPKLPPKLQTYKVISEFIIDRIKPKGNEIYKTEMICNNIIIVSAKNIELPAGIVANIYQKDITKKEGDIAVIENTIELTTHGPASIIFDFIEKLVAEDEQKIKEARKKSKLHYICDIDDVVVSTYSTQSNNYPFETTKSFDNLFFDKKSKLIEKLDYFLNNKDTYSRLGMPYTLGIMLTGAPGSGKTSIIKAAAKYTSRNIIRINTSNINSIQKFKHIVGNFIGRECYSKIDDSILVFEEIDCGGWADIVLSRDAQRDAQRDETKIDIDKALELIDAAKDNGNSKCKEQKLTMADLLEFLDGIIEYSGRIIIMTSNRPETLDPALLRPGRIDMKITINKLSKKDVNSLYKLWFGRPVPFEIYTAMKDYCFTQAEVGLLFSSADLGNIHKELLKLPPTLND